MKTKVLFIEDDHNLGRLLKANLEMKGLDVTWAQNGREGLDLFAAGAFNLCIIDVMMPLVDGFSVAREIRTVDPDVPIIFLTARSRDEDKIAGFEAGCDDYVTKPFNPQELYLRILAILKRMQQPDEEPCVIVIGNFTFDSKQMLLESAEEKYKLSAKDVELLQILASNRNKFVPRNVILEHVWGGDSYFSSKSMDVYISKLRKYLKSDPAIEILTAYGGGYKLIVK